jgi:glutathione S-transferase
VLFRSLEKEFAARSLRPADPALGFLDALIEDFADEWCSKIMFHYRWADAEGAAWARGHLIRQINPSLDSAAVEKMGSWFAQRQIGRLDLVGCGVATAPLMQAAYLRLLALVDALVATRPFLFGARPAAADFALGGQLAQLALYDPSSAQLAHQQAPRVVAWVQRLEDLSGWQVKDTQWLDRERAIPALRPLLAELGATYAPYLLANAAAKLAGAATVDCVVQGVSWSQKPVSYQLKCLQWLRQHFARLSAADQDWVRQQLVLAGAEALLSP